MLATGRIGLDARSLRWAGAGLVALATLRPAVGDGGTEVPCPLRSLTGVPCPFCGMTRGVNEVVRGHVVDALVLNPGSVLLVVATVLLLVTWRVQRVSVPVWLPITALVALWSFELFKLGAGLPL